MKILFLEEKQSEIKLFENHLEDAFKSFEARTARTKKDFIRLVKDFLPDVILAGSTLSKYGTSEALKHLKQQETGIAFVFITNDKNSELTRTLMNEGADDFVLKTDMHHLFTVIHKAIKKKNAESKKIKADMIKKLNEEKLQSSDNESECIFQIGSKGELIEMNPAALELTESSSEIELGKSKLWEFIDKSDIKKLRSFHHSIFEGNEKEFTFRFVGYKGTPHIIVTHAVPLRNDKDDVTSALLVGREITSKIATDENLKKGEVKQTFSGKKKSKDFLK